MAEEKKNVGGRPKGVTNSKKELKDEIAKVLEKNVKILKDALESDELSAKEKAQLMKDLLPYGAAKKTEDKKEIPDHLKYVKIVIKGYKPDENPYADKPDKDESDD
jgi:methionine synthase II (cobalamin-independent)